MRIVCLDRNEAKTDLHYFPKKELSWLGRPPPPTRMSNVEKYPRCVCGCVIDTHVCADVGALCSPLGAVARSAHRCRRLFASTKNLLSLGLGRIFKIVACRLANKTRCGRVVMFRCPGGIPLALGQVISRMQRHRFVDRALPGPLSVRWAFV